MNLVELQRAPRPLRLSRRHLHRLCRDRDGERHDVQRHGTGGEHQLQLPGACDGRGRQRRRLFECGKRDDAAILGLTVSGGRK
jgi:hypothetical protein